MNQDIPVTYPAHQTNIPPQQTALRLFPLYDATTSQQKDQNGYALPRPNDSHQHPLILDTISPTYLVALSYRDSPCPDYIPLNSQSCHSHHQLSVPSPYLQN